MTEEPLRDELPQPGSKFPWKSLLKLAVSASLLIFLVGRSDTTALLSRVRNLSVSWLLVALVLYLVMLVLSAWRWGQLLTSQNVQVPTARLLQSYLVATFFNNFLPSNIGGDVVRIRDTAEPTGSRTLATTIVLLDRGIGLLGLLVVAALAASALSQTAEPQTVWPGFLWAPGVSGLGILAGIVAVPSTLRLALTPLRWLRSQWVDLRLDRLEQMFRNFRQHPGGLMNCFAGAVGVQLVLVAFYMAIGRSADIQISFVHLAVLVPLSFVIQMLPISMNGLGVREATFSYYFRTLGLPAESALVLSLLGAATTMVFSLSGAAAYVVRR
ncbi:MAG: lysylphosphatidylglycerol synthase transmembrane domain-containing protein [Vicinamibacterales bacterium]